MTLQLANTETLSHVSWLNPSSGLWVATRNGEHAGMVERSEGAYHARSARGRALGSFDDFDSARDAVDGGVDPSDAVPRGLTPALIVINGGVAVIAVALAYTIFGR